MGEKQLHMQIFPEKEGKQKKNGLLLRGTKDMDRQGLRLAGKESKMAKKPPALAAPGADRDKLS